MNEIVTEAMAKAGSDFASNALQGSYSKALGGLGGSITWEEWVEGYQGENLDLLKRYADREIDSVTGIYLAMERARVKEPRHCERCGRVLPADTSTSVYGCTMGTDYSKENQS